MKQHIYVIAISASILIAGLGLFGLTGLKTSAAFIFFFVLPGYAILLNFDLEEDERIFISLFASLGLFALVVHILNKLVPSMRISAILAAVLIIAAGVFYKMRKK